MSLGAVKIVTMSFIMCWDKKIVASGVKRLNYLAEKAWRDGLPHLTSPLKGEE